MAKDPGLTNTVRIWTLENYDFWSQAVDDAWSESGHTKSLAVDSLASVLREIYVNEAPLDGEPTVYTDLLAQALEKIDWCGIAKSLLVDCE